MFGLFKKFRDGFPNMSDRANALQIFFIARQLGREPKRFSDEFRRFQGSVTERYGPNAIRIFALGKLTGKDPADLEREFEAISRIPGIDPEVAFRLFSIPYARRSLIDAKQVFFL